MRLRTAQYVTIIAALVLSSFVIAGCGGPSENLTDSQARQEHQLKAESGETETSTASKTVTEKMPAPAKKTEAKPAAAATLSADQLASAKSLFVGACGGCHTLSDAGTNGAVGPNLDQTKFTKDMIAHQIANGKGMMPAGQLKGADADLVATYVAQAAAAS